MTEEDKKIAKAFIAMIKRNGWKPMQAKNGLAWFGGKTHKQLADYLPKEDLENHWYEDIDFLVVGYRTEWERKTSDDELSCKS